MEQDMGATTRTWRWPRSKIHVGIPRSRRTAAAASDNRAHWRVLVNHRRTHRQPQRRRQLFDKIIFSVLYPKFDLRLAKYGALTWQEATVALPPYVDVSTVTLVVQHKVAGLQSANRGWRVVRGNSIPQFVYRIDWPSTASELHALDS
ncbi:hypothetical protein MUK42_04565 [Musa troglodytarum]|uniref:Uncharacterized protein n=1 Tax=Musa troglodytarum TaxID=320322 RepID=A0A9E7GA00_9LILI|nr:hypothetical protein MUK42_04565 [Musa troglodytarum]